MTTRELQHKPAVQGSCHCGKIKYQSSKPSYHMTYCYCTTCRSLHGAPFAPFVDVRREDLEWFERSLSSSTTTTREGDGEWKNLGHSDETPAITKLRLSKAATRTFCASCHSPLTMVYNAVPDEVGLVATTIDEKLSAAPVPKVEQHIYLAQKPGWYDIPVKEGVKLYDGPTDYLKKWLEDAQE
jgi:hypothetical protein